MKKYFGAVGLVAMLPVLCAQSATPRKTAATKVSAAKTHHAAAAFVKGKTAARGKALAGAKSTKSAKGKTHAVRVEATAESRKLTSAFTASAQLRPMAQQLL